MVFILKKSAQELTAEQIRLIFNAANDCYKFRLDSKEMERAIDYLTREGISLLKRRILIDYRPWMGAKFFIEPSGEETRIWAYSSDKPQKRESSKFNNILEQIFS